MRRILRTTGLMGVSSLVVILCAIVRTKIIAVEAGPAGVGLLGLLAAMLAVIVTIAGAGLGTSGVRSVAAAVATGDEHEVTVNRRALTVACGVLGVGAALLVVALAPVIAEAVLREPELTFEVRLLGLAVLATVAASAPTAALNGFRRIRALSTIGPVGALAGTAAVGVAAAVSGDVVMVAIVAPPVATLLVALWHARRLPPYRSRPAVRDLLRSVRELLGLGVVFLATALVGTLAALVLRLMIDEHLGRDATGQFQAAYGIAGYYVGFLLQALAADYFPKLSGIADDEKAVNDAVNEQAEASLLLAAPLVMALIALTPLAVRILYTDAFSETVGILRWQLLGEFLRVMVWAIGFILVVRRARLVYLLGEAGWNVAYVAAVFVGIRIGGLELTGVAYTLSYLAMFFVYLALARRETGFRLSRANARLLAGTGATSLAVFVVVGLGPAGLVAGLLLTLAVAVFSLRRIAAQADWRLPERLARR
jgi:enterobacterial common antigen flippase